MMDSSTQTILLEVLHRASSQNTADMKEAERKLFEWETQPGFYSALLNIFSNYNVDLNVRWMATVCTKNGIDKYWRGYAENSAISDSEKQIIRAGLITSFNEPISQIAVQKAVLISKIARTDCPKDWPELFPTLLHAISVDDSLVQHRSLLVLHHVVKAISSKRLMGDRRQFQEFTSNIYSFILNMWNTYTEKFHRNVEENAETEVITKNLEKALLTLRILRKLTIYGFYKPHEHMNVVSFLNNIFERIKTSLECRKQLLKTGTTYLVDHCSKYIIHLTKILHSTLDIHPLSYVTFITPSLELSYYYLFTTAGQPYLFERLTIQFFNLIKGILLCREYRPPKMMEKNKHVETLEAHRLINEFFQRGILVEMCRWLVTRYFILTQEDLESWDADPELYVNDESGETWKYSLRPSMETVFATIFHEFRDELAPVLLEMIMETKFIVSPDDMEGILKKDAVYNAVSIAAYDMYEEVDFDQWFTNTLTQELAVKHNNYRVIRRRVSHLIGSWTGIKLSAQLRPALYDCVIELLGQGEDIAVRLTASTALRHAIDDFEFNAEQFMPYVDKMFNLLFELLREAKECDTKMHVLNVMTLMIERIGQTITPLFDVLLHYLPELWQQSEEHNMLRCAIVSTLVQLVAALGTVTPEMNQFLVPIIQLGTDVDQNASVYLMEDCFELWIALTENTASMNSELMQLLGNVGKVLETSCEHLRQCLYIVLRYVLLSPELVMRSCGAQIVTICDGMMGDMWPEGISVILKLIDTFIRASPALGCETVKPILPRIFETIYKGDNLPSIFALYVCIASRVLLASPEVFIQTLNVLAQKNNDNVNNILMLILDAWTRQMCNVQTEQSKLLSLALLNLLTMQIQPVLERFGKIAVNILETLNDVIKVEDNGVLTDSLLITDEKSPSYFNDNEKYTDNNHEVRKRELILKDPVYTTVLKDYLQSQLYVLKSQLGDLQYQQLLSIVDNDTISQLKEYVTF